MMIPSYCINIDLPKRIIAQQHFRARGIEPTFIKGVQGSLWGVKTSRTYELDGDDGFRLNPKHCGINLSHWMLWQHLLLNKVEEALILEDDVVLIPDFIQQFEEYKAELPADWQLAYVGYLEHEEIVAAKVQRKVTDKIMVARNLFGTHCYLVKYSALPILMEYCQYLWAPSDIQLDILALPHLAHYTFSKSLANQRNTHLPQDAQYLKGEWISGE